MVNGCGPVSVGAAVNGSCAEPEPDTTTVDDRPAICGRPSAVTDDTCDQTDQYICMVHPPTGNSGPVGTGSTGCTSPNGKAGEIDYNLDQGVMQYCNGANWINMGPKIATAGTSAPTVGLVGHWKLDETTGTTASDSSGNGNDGTVNGTDFDTDSVAGVSGTALSFDGSSDYVETTYNTDYASGGFTLSAWAKTSSSAIMRIFSKWQAPGTNQKWLLFNNGQIEFGITNSSGGITSTNTYNDGQWHLFTAVADGTDMYLYVDGVQTDTDTHDNTFDTNALAWRIGARNDGAEYFNGEIDDARIYNRALSATEVADLYATTGGGATPVTGCPNIGDVCDDGSLYAGDINYGSGNEKFYITDTDQGIYQWKAGSGDDMTPNSSNDGLDNIANLNSAITNFPAINACATLTLHGHSDWYLPSRNELREACNNKAAINANATDAVLPGGDFYWTSGEETNFNAQRESPLCSGTSISKTTNEVVRCIRRGSSIVGGTCSSPRGVAGELIYNDAHTIMQFCNGSEWVGIGDAN